MTDERTEWVILGRRVGTGTGWDGDFDRTCIYEFRAATGINIPDGDVWFDWMKGLVEIYSDDGEIQWSEDMVTVFANTSRCAISATPVADL